MTLIPDDNGYVDPLLVTTVRQTARLDPSVSTRCLSGISLFLTRTYITQKCEPERIGYSVVLAVTLIYPMALRSTKAPQDVVEST